MTRKRTSAELALAVFPSTRGFGYAVLEGPRSLIDWGVKSARCPQKNLESLQKIRELAAFYRPDVLVLEDYEGPGSRRAKRIRTLINMAAAYAAGEGMSTTFFSRAAVRACFGLTTKRQIAEAIARRFPELEPRLPLVRRIWMSEDRRMGIFDAVSLAVTFFHNRRRTKQAAPNPTGRTIEWRQAGPNIAEVDEAVDRRRHARLAAYPSSSSLDSR
jgi:hypothetical protein